MKEVLAVVEYRQGVVRDITFELLTYARKLAQTLNTKCTALLLGTAVEKYIPQLESHAHRLIVVDSDVFANFNAETYQIAVSEIMRREKPAITLIGHTAAGMDLGPALGAQLDIPCATDCIRLDIEASKVRAIRSMFDGKLQARILLRENATYIITLRSGSVAADQGNLQADVIRMELAVTEPDYRRLVEYIEAAVGEVDITKSDIIVAIGRGIREQTNLALMEDFAKAIGGVLGCTRPIVDAGWLPKDRQIGSSGKTVKPKLYIALGISGAFQHVAGMKNADTIIAVNKDPNAPIFNDADFGVVEDLFKVVPVLKNKIRELKGAKV